jgi:hypothetical protein
MNWPTNKQNNKVLTGTAVRHVGRRTDASPLVPFLILLELSIMVKGVEYPMETP